MKSTRIGCGQGFWGDWPEAPVRLVEGGPLDYLVMDYLAEITMSIMQKQKSRDPRLGYAKDFLPLVERILPRCVEKSIRIIANAGGVNPRACAEAVRGVAVKLGLSDSIKVGTVAGDDISGRLDSFLSRGVNLENMETGESLHAIRERVQSANVYFGAWPIVEALKKGANVIVTGRCTDTGLSLAPMAFEFGWKEEDWNLLAAGTVAGHTVECGAQSTGGNSLVQWQKVPLLAKIGYPIIEAFEDGTFVITKHKGTGGRVDVPTVKEQLVYEMGDPRAYITPDCVADFTTIQLRQDGKDRVRFSGIQGRPATEFYKVSMSYSSGWKAVGTLVYAWPEAYAKAKVADKVVRERLKSMGLKFEEILTEFVGVDACHGPLSGDPSPDIAEVQFRIGVRSQNRDDVERFTREIVPLVLNGPPTVTGFAGGRPKVEEIIAYWPALIPKAEVASLVEIL
ncbi:MAG: acyclic terpene utilization AtuA family protein [Terriglobia bacterium]